jgi:hypothetical protein
MPAAAPPARAAASPRPLDWTAALLSYLVPGLGQIQQGRYAKGALFLVALLGLFFFGMYLGSWQNVYIETAPLEKNKGEGSRGSWVLANVRTFGQLPIGIAAWPAVVQYFTYTPPAYIDEYGQPRDINNRPFVDGPPHPVLGKFQRRPLESEVNDLLRNSDKNPDLGWTYTVIAGLLNLLVIYDALAGAAFATARARPPAPSSAPAKATS